MPSSLPDTKHIKLEKTGSLSLKSHVVQRKELYKVYIKATQHVTGGMLRSERLIMSMEKGEDQGFILGCIQRA